MKDDILFDSYVAYELLYKTNMSKKYKDNLLFPNDWYAILNYQLKIDILMEAINKNVLIIDTENYKEFRQR